MDPLYEIAKNQNEHLKQFNTLVKAVDDLQTRIKELEAYKPNLFIICAIPALICWYCLK